MPEGCPACRRIVEALKGEEQANWDLLATLGIIAVIPVSIAVIYGIQQLTGKT